MTDSVRRVGLGIAPNFSLLAMSESGAAKFAYHALQSSDSGMTCLPMFAPLSTGGAGRATGVLRKAFVGAMIVNGGCDAGVGQELRARPAACVSVGI